MGFHCEDFLIAELEFQMEQVPVDKADFSSLPAISQRDGEVEELQLHTLEHSGTDEWHVRSGVNRP